MRIASPNPPSSDDERRLMNSLARSALRLGSIASGLRPLSRRTRPSLNSTIAIGMTRDFGVVRDEDDRVPFARERFEQRHDFDAAARIERARRLVGENDLAAVHERARDRHTLLLAAG